MPVASLPTGVDLYYESHGEGEPLVLIPSTAFGCNVWHAHQVPGLGQDLRLVIMDVRGVGRSGKPAGTYTIEHMACDIVALLDQLGIDKAHVLGHSMGGRIALSLTLTFPGRVKSLIMAASGSGAAARPPGERVSGVPYGFVDEVVRMGFEDFVRHEIREAPTYFTDEYRRAHADEVKTYFDMIWEQHAKWPEYLRLVMGRTTFEATHRLAEVAVPTLVAVGEKDDVGANHLYQGRVLAERIPGAEFKLLPGQSHGFFWQAPDETNAWILDWVRRHLGPRLV